MDFIQGIKMDSRSSVFEEIAALANAKVDAFFHCGGFVIGSRAKNIVDCLRDACATAFAKANCCMIIGNRHNPGENRVFYS